MSVAQVSPTLAFTCEVESVEQLSPSFRRVRLTGDCLRDMHDGGDLGPRDTRIKVLLGVDGDPDVPAPAMTGTWYRDWLARDPAERGVMRTYTARRREGSRLDVDFVVHPDDAGGAGPACRFAMTARSGDRLTVLGPNAATGCAGWFEFLPPPPPADLLLVGDETAVPAIGSILSTLPAGHRGRALLEVPSYVDFLELPTAADVEVTWLSRGTARRGAPTAAALRSVVAPGAVPAELPPPDEDLLWEAASSGGGGFYAWVAGEAAVVRDVRRYLVRDCGVDRRSVSFMGYWREGRAEAS